MFASETLKLGIVFRIIKQSLNFAFVLAEELWRSRRILSHNTLLDLHNSLDDTDAASFNKCQMSYT